ncbi:hypothetical protein PS3A_04860 [Pseudomonas sp. 3A(2025)]
MLQNIITSSAIEGKPLNVSSVRSSLARRLGLEDHQRVSPRSEGLAELMLDATRHWQAGLDLERVLHWHRLLFVSQESLVSRHIRVGDLLGDKPSFENGISAAQYQSVAKVSKATATRHLSDLLDKGCLEKLPGGGRSTRYQVRWD